MKRTAIVIAALWLAFGAGSAQAQFFFNPFRKAPPPVPPADRVGQLISIIKSDPDESKRSSAVVELRDFDAKAFPQIVDVLADVAQTDSKAGVRAEAVSGLVRIRPVSSTAGQAIEHVSQKDDNWRNRMNAQAALVRYRLAGYSSTMPNADPRAADPKGTTSNAKNQSAEPPLGTQAPGGAPPIIYHDQFGKVIPAPKNLPSTGTPGTFPPGVIGTPTSNPGGKSPFGPIGPATPPTSYQQPRPQITPTAVPPAPVALSPVQPGPVAVEPVFRNVNPPIAAPQQTPVVLNPAPIYVAPSVPAAPVSGPTLVSPQPIDPGPGPALGPSLELPPQPINVTPLPVSPPQGPPLGGSTSPLQPSGRMEPSPRLSPVN